MSLTRTQLLHLMDRAERGSLLIEEAAQLRAGLQGLDHTRQQLTTRLAEIREAAHQYRDNRISAGQLYVAVEEATS